MNAQEKAYDLHLKQLVRKKGVLVKRMEVRDSFLFDRPTTEYRKNLGAVSVKGGVFAKKIKSVYVVYEDFDGSIKYYEYPQYKQSTYMKGFMPSLFILLMTFIAMLVIDINKGFDSIFEFALYLIMINLTINVIFVVFSVRKAKRINLKGK